VEDDIAVAAVAVAAAASNCFAYHIRSWQTTHSVLLEVEELGDQPTVHYIALQPEHGHEVADQLRPPTTPNSPDELAEVVEVREVKVAAEA